MTRPSRTPAQGPSGSEQLARAFSLVRPRDPRWLSLLLALVIVVPSALSLTVEQPVGEDAQRLFQRLDSMPPGSLVLLAADYDPAGAAELQPMVESVMEVAFRRDLRLVSLSLWPQAPPLVDRAFAKVGAARHGKQYGHDFVNLGFKEGRLVVMNKLGISLADAFPEDGRGNPLASLPLMQQAIGLDDFSLMLCATAGLPGCGEWIAQVQGRFVDNLAALATSQAAAELAPFAQSGQLVALVPGMAGAAQLEQLSGTPGAATRGMAGQAGAHGLIALVLLVGIAGALLRRRSER